MRFAALLLALLISAASAHAQSPQIYSPDGRYLGNFNIDRYDPDSIANPYGQYGNPYSPDSVNNPYGKYGAYGSPYASRRSRVLSRNHVPQDWRQDPIIGYWRLDAAPPPN